MAAQSSPLLKPPRPQKKVPPTSAAQMAPHNPSSVNEVRALLGELRDLLDTFGPPWYHESHYRRIDVAMTLLREASVESVS